MLVSKHPNSKLQVKFEAPTGDASYGRYTPGSRWTLENGVEKEARRSKAFFHNTRSMGTLEGCPETGCEQVPALVGKPPNFYSSLKFGKKDWLD